MTPVTNLRWMEPWLPVDAIHLLVFRCMACTEVIKKVSVLIAYFNHTITLTTHAKYRANVALTLQPYFHHTSNATYEILGMVVNKKNNEREISS